MNVFHRTRRDSRVLNLLALVFAFTLALIFMLLGVGALTLNEIDLFTRVLGLVFGLVGLAVFVVCVRGAWMMTNGAITHVFSVDEEFIEWGFLGKEVREPIKSLEGIYWNESDGLTCVLHFRDGRRVRLPYIENVLSHKSRAAFLGFMAAHHPSIPVGDWRPTVLNQPLYRS